MAEPKLPTGDTMVLLSGGIDSAVLLQAVHAAKPGRVAGLFVDFGQSNASREQAFAQRLANRLGVPLHIGELPGMLKLIYGELEPPHILIAEGDGRGHPRGVNSSGIQPAFATIAAWLGYRHIHQAVTKTDVDAWDPPVKAPDRNAAINNLLQVAHLQIKFDTPFAVAELSNEDVLRFAAASKFDVNATWSCLWGYRYHCGKCPRCVARQSRFRQAQLPDPTRYATPEMGLA
jgi:7-cyano-7-deazaguanine synthase